MQFQKGDQLAILLGEEVDGAGAEDRVPAATQPVLPAVHLRVFGTGAVQGEEGDVELGRPQLEDLALGVAVIARHHDGGLGHAAPRRLGEVVFQGGSEGQGTVFAKVLAVAERVQPAQIVG